MTTDLALTVTLLGTGSPLPDADRAGPATLVQGGGRQFLFDAGRGVLMRLAAAGSSATSLTAVLLTHLHSDHFTDLGDVITSRWILSFEPSPLTIVGPVGTKAVVDHLLASLGPDIGYRIAHHSDLTVSPLVEVIEVTGGSIDLDGPVKLRCAPTDHRPVDASIGYRLDHEGVSVVIAGDTVPCPGLDALCDGAQVLVHSVIRKDLIANIPLQRLQDIIDYHSSPEEAAQTAQRAGLETLVLTHYVPAFRKGDGEPWHALAAAHFTGTIEVGDDLHRIEIAPRNRDEVDR